MCVPLDQSIKLHGPAVSSHSFGPHLLTPRIVRPLRPFSPVFRIYQLCTGVLELLAVCFGGFPPLSCVYSPQKGVYALRDPCFARPFIAAVCVRFGTFPPKIKCLSDPWHR